MTLWYSRLGHPNKLILHQVLSQFSVPAPSNTSLGFCEAYQHGKLHQISFPSAALQTESPLQMLHTDNRGHAPLPSIEGYRYYIALVDDFIRYTWVYPLRLKSEAATIYMQFIIMVKRQFGTKVKCLQSDWGGEFRKLQASLQELQIRFQHPFPHTHQQHGKIVRRHRSVVEIGLTLLAQASMDLKFWWEAFDSTTYLLNRLPTPALDHSSPFESLYGRRPDYQFLKVFGCACFPYLQPYNRDKLAFKTSKCLFLGYSSFHKGYKCLHPSGRVYISRSVRFNKNSFPYQTLFTSNPSLNAPNFVKTYGAPAFVLPHSSSTKSSNNLPSSCPPPLCSSSLPSSSSSTSKHTLCLLPWTIPLH